jgi:signal transduction histidine kinase
MPEQRDFINRRIKEKRSDHRSYNFSKKEDSAFKSFFDLAQELDNIGDFYDLCVAIPKAFFDLDARLYLKAPRGKKLKLVSSTEDGGPPLLEKEPEKYPCCTERNSLVFNVRGKKVMMDKLPFKASDTVMGVMEVYPSKGLDEHHQLFFEKFANRIGFNLHNRFLVQKNVEHLKFIRSLVADIEHNVIAPNMVYKILLRNLKERILRNQQLEAFFEDYLSEEKEPKTEDLRRFMMELSEVNLGLTDEISAIENHYKNMSLFLETLLRRGHFEQGRLIPRAKKCNMKKDVIKPQLDQYIERFRRMGIAVDDRLRDIPNKETVSVVDVGLMSQVYANLFSNAIKYTTDVPTPDGKTLKYISLSSNVVRDFFGPGKDGVKYNIFSTGPHINPAEHEKIFEEGYRSEDASNRPGTGHGLSFVKSILEIHNGVTGCELSQFGNNFYLILPK